MRDIPVFSTENGVASLTLKEIPYKKEAYIFLQQTSTPEKLLMECVDFCVTAGAKAIYATGHDCLAAYPLHTVILRMSRSSSWLPGTDASLTPVESSTFDQWRKIYNERMVGVPGAATITAFDEKTVVESGSAYFIHKADQLLGIGKASAGKIEAVATVARGSGREVFLALCGALSEDSISLDVAENNISALRLYKQLGFEVISELTRWYRIL